MTRPPEHRYTIEGEQLTAGEVADRVASLAPKLKRDTVLNRLVQHGIRTWEKLCAPVGRLRKLNSASGKKLHTRMFKGKRA